MTKYHLEEHVPTNSFTVVAWIRREAGFIGEANGIWLAFRNGEDEGEPFDTWHEAADYLAGFVEMEIGE